MKSSLFFLIFFLTRVLSVFAEWSPPFDLDTCVGKAKAITIGNLDASGVIKVTKVIRGGHTLDDTVQIGTGDYAFKRLQTLIGKKGPFEVVAFLDERTPDEWRLVLQYAGIVAFDGEDVYLAQDDLMSSQLEKNAHLTKDNFLDALDASIKSNDERLRLVALPRSPERTKQLVDFALQHSEIDNSSKLSRYQAQYQLGEVAAALRKPTAGEKSIVLEALREAKTIREQVILLKLAGWIPLISDAMDSVALFLPRANPAAVREAAMDALHEIDAYKAIDYLLPHLVTDDPQLGTVLINFGPQSYPPQDRLLNIHAVDALRKLADSMKGPDEIPIENGYMSGAVSGQLCHYMHPKLLPILFKRAIYDESPDSAQVFSNFSSAVGLKYSRDDKKSWEAWWEKAQPLIEGNLNLQTATGRDLWMDHYAHADPATQKILMNLWFFEPTVDEAALVEAAVHNDSAKYALSELWQRHRLSAATKKSIVERFIKFKLVNTPPQESKEDKTLYGASLETSITFPFPMVAEFETRSDFTLGDRLPRFRDEDRGVICMGYTPMDNASKGATIAPIMQDHFPSPPQARGIIEYRESDFPNSHDILWTLQWNLGPIRLTNAVP